MYRDTYVEINLKNISSNIKKIITKYNNYKYYFGVVKADCYGHYGNEVIEEVINAGCNYLAVATLDEALEIRDYNKEVPILCLGIIPIRHLDICLLNNITITVSNFEYLNNVMLLNNNYKNLKVHLKINTGMNRLGIKDKEEFNKIYSICKSSFKLEGIYTHIYEANNTDITNNQIKMFEEFVSPYKNDVDIIHYAASDAMMNYQKSSIANGCRLGIVMYGLTTNDLNLSSTFKLVSHVIQINKLKQLETVGYNGTYTALNDELVAVVPIGYADGIIRKNSGRYVYINNKKYPIVGNICMDMLFIKVDENVKVEDEVLIIKDNEHIFEIADYLETIPYEVICNIGKRVRRVYVKD